MTNTLRSIAGADIKNKTVIVRANFDVKLKDGQIVDDTKIKESLLTLQHLIKNNCKTVILSSLGDAKGIYSDELSLMPIRFELGRLLQKQVKFANIDHCENSIKFMELGDVLLLENLTFSTGETSKKDSERKKFVKKFSELADVYVNEAFGMDYKFASLYELPKMMKSYLGFGFLSELENLDKLMNKRQSPFVFILGGKAEDEIISIIDKFTKIADKIIIGGELAYTFLKAAGVKVGDSVVYEKGVSKAEKILSRAEKSRCEIVLPIDHLCSDNKDGVSKAIEVTTQHINKGLYGRDLGPRTLTNIREIIESSQTIVWYGEMGSFELENFSKGTEAVGEYIALSTPKDALKVAVGDQTTYAINYLKIKPKRFNYISIAGQKMLEFMAGSEFECLKLYKEKHK